MRIDSFIDVITDYDPYTIASLKEEGDMFSGDLEAVELEIHSRDEIVNLSTSERSKIGLDKLRIAILKKINRIKNLVLVDFGKNNIFTNVENDDFFFFKLANKIDNFKIIRITKERTIEIILNKAFSNLVQKLPSQDNKAYFNCIIL